MSITEETRREAYEEIKLTRNTRQTEIWSYLNANGAMNADELAVALFKTGKIPAPHRSFVAPRLTELKEANQVRVVGKSKSPISGRNSAVWEAVAE